MVRAVLALDMRAWGCAVCAVASEQAAIARLRLRGADPRPARGPRGGRLTTRWQLRHLRRLDATLNLAST